MVYDFAVDQERNHPQALGAKPPTHPPIDDTGAYGTLSSQLRVFFSGVLLGFLILYCVYVFILSDRLDTMDTKLQELETTAQQMEQAKHRLEQRIQQIAHDCR